MIAIGSNNNNFIITRLLVMTRNLPNVMAIAEVYNGLVVKTVMKVWLETHLFSSIGEFEPKQLEVEARQ